MTIDRFFAWVEYMPAGVKKAWCELTGGHDNELLCAWTGREQATHVRLHCFKCGRETKWFPIGDGAARKGKGEGK